MTEWYYHDPLEGRVGPLTADRLRDCYRERRIQRDTLVWHAGLREWSPLEQQAEALDLASVTPDASLPPPLTRAVTQPASRSSAPPGAQGAGHAPPPRRRLSGCLIALLVAAGLSVLVVGIIAAIAIPAYSDYAKRAKSAQAGAPAAFDPDRFADDDGKVRALLRAAMAARDVRNPDCPDTFEFESVQVRNPALTGRFDVSPAAAIPGGCRYTVTYTGHGLEVDGVPLRYDLRMVGDDVTLTCDAGAMPAGVAPLDCE